MGYEPQTYTRNTCSVNEIFYFFGHSNSNYRGATRGRNHSPLDDTHVYIVELNWKILEYRSNVRPRTLSLSRKKGIEFFRLLEK